MTEKPWEKFEELTEDIFKKLSSNSKFEKIERNIKIKGRDGLRQVDVLLTTTTAGLNLKTVIECKDHSSKISVGTIDAFHSKLQDINANKGIVVARNGFSSKAVAKAKRVGISLYTAHEAQSSKWNIDVEIPILICEVIPNDIFGNFQILPGNENIGKDFPIDKGQFCVNGLNLQEYVRELWNTGKLKYNLTESEQIVDIPNLNAPYFITNSNPNFPKIEVNDFRILLQLEIQYYLGNLNEIENSQLIKDITEGKMTFFINTFPLTQYRETFRKIKKETIPDNKLSVEIRSTFIIGGLNLSEFGIEKDGARIKL